MDKPTNKKPVSDQSKKFEKDFNNTMAVKGVNLTESESDMVLSEVDDMLNEKEQSLKKKIFNLAKMESLVFSDPKLTTVYNEMAENGEEKYGYHYNETIMNMIFNDYVLNSTKYIQKYKMAIPKKKKRRDKSGINQLKKSGEETITKEKDTTVDETTGAGSSGVYVGPAVWGSGDLMKTNGKSDAMKKPIWNGGTIIKESAYITDPKAFGNYYKKLNENANMDMYTTKEDLNHLIKISKEKTGRGLTKDHIPMLAGDALYTIAVKLADRMLPIGWDELADINSMWDYIDENGGMTMESLKSAVQDACNDRLEEEGFSLDQLEEKSSSKAQQRFMGMVHAYQKGEIEPDKVNARVKKVAKNMKPEDAEDFASTKHDDLPEKIDDNLGEGFVDDKTLSAIKDYVRAYGLLKNKEYKSEEIDKLAEKLSDTLDYDRATKLAKIANNELTNNKNAGQTNMNKFRDKNLDTINLNEDHLDSKEDKIAFIIKGEEILGGGSEGNAFIEKTLRFLPEFAVNALYREYEFNLKRKGVDTNTIISSEENTEEIQVDEMSTGMANKAGFAAGNDINTQKDAFTLDKRREQLATSKAYINPEIRNYLKDFGIGVGKGTDNMFLYINADVTIRVGSNAYYFSNGTMEDIDQTLKRKLPRILKTVQDDLNGKKIEPIKKNFGNVSEITETQTLNELSVHDTVEYISDRTDEIPFEMGGEKWQFVNAKYPDGKTDIGVYRNRTDLVYDYAAWREAFNINENPALATMGTAAATGFGQAIGDKVADKVLGENANLDNESEDMIADVWKAAIGGNLPEMSQMKQDIIELMKRDNITFENMKKELDNNNMLGENEEFIPHGSYTVSNSGGYEIMLSDDGDAAKVRDAFGSDNPKISDWLEIEHIPNQETGESDPVIDPNGYNIPLNQVMRINETEASILDNIQTTMANKPEPIGINGTSIPTGTDQMSEELDMEELNEELKAYSIYLSKMKKVNEDRKPSTLVLKDRLGKENKSNFKKDFANSDTKDTIDIEKELMYQDEQTDVGDDPQKLGMDIEKEELKKTKGVAFKNVGDSTNLKGDEIPKRNATSKEQEEVDLIRKGLGDFVYDNKPSEKFEKRMKQDMGDELYEKRQKRMEFSAKAPMYNKDTQPMEDGIDKEQFNKNKKGYSDQMGNIKESIITGRYVNLLNKSRIVDFTADEVTEINECEDYFKLDLTAFGNTFVGRTKDKKVLINEGVVNFIDKFDFFTDGDKIFKMKKTKTQVNEGAKEKGIVNEEITKIKHLLNYKPQNFINTSKVKKNRGF